MIFLANSSKLVRFQPRFHVKISQVKIASTEKKTHQNFVSMCQNPFKWHLRQESNLQLILNGNIIKQISNKTYITENIYDANNKLIETKVNGKTSIKKSYDDNGNEIVSIENGVEKRTSYDALNRLEKVEVPSASKRDEFVAIQTVTYDETGNALKITDASGHAEEKKYDANNNVIEETNKNGIKTLYEYDCMNNPIKVQNHEGRYVTSCDKPFSTSGTITDFKVYWTSLFTRPPRVRHISFSSQPPDLLSWFYVYLLDFSLLSNLILHLASSGFCS